jgi:hypothetical protein
MPSLLTTAEKLRKKVQKFSVGRQFVGGKQVEGRH